MKPTDSKAREALSRIQKPVADTTELTSLRSADLTNLQFVIIKSPKSIFIYDKDDTTTADPGSIEVPDDIAASAAYISDPTTAPGRWTNVSGAQAAASGEVGAGAGSFRALGATTTNLAYTLTGNVLEANANGAQGAIDGVTYTVNKVILVKNQTAPEANGLFYFTTMGGASAKASMTRVPGFDSDADALTGTSVFVATGTVNADTIWDLTTDDPITLNTTGLTFTKRLTTADLTTLKVPAVQGINATLVAGTVTISSGIVVASTSEVMPELIGHITGSTDFGSLGELKSSRVNGIDGVGTVVIEAIGSDGNKDTDAAGAIRVVILTPL